VRLSGKTTMSVMLNLLFLCDHCFTVQFN